MSCHKILLPGLFLALATLFLACDHFPRDTRDSLKTARSQGLQVGVTENPPYVVITGDSISGTEVELLRKFAREKGLQLEMTEGSESELVKKLEQAQLHVLIGGFEKKTSWKKKVAMTGSYDQKHVFFIPRGENSLMWELEGFIQENLKK